MEYYIGGIYGLRGFLVIIIAIYHALTIFYPESINYLQGGFIAVESFFVLSGFLITRILIRDFFNDRDRFTTTISFLRRRFLRIFPALFFTVILFNILTYFLSLRSVKNIEEESIFSLGFLYNFYLIFKDIPYFEKFESVNLFLHLWSLSIEAQLYLLVGILFFLGTFLKNKGKIFITLTFIIFIFLSSGLNFYYYNFLDMNPDRIYFSTECRSFGFFIGGVVALWEDSIKEKVREFFGYIAGLLGLISLTIGFFLFNNYLDFFYPFGFLISDFFSVLIIVGILNSNYLRESLDILRWLGKRSYSFYLLHYPLFIMIDQIYGTNIIYVILALVLAISFSDTVYHFIENPFRRLSFRLDFIRLSISSSVAIFCLILFYHLPNYLNFIERDIYPKEKADTKAKKQIIERENKKDGYKISDIHKVNDPDKDFGQSTEKIFFIGDSVLLGASGYIKKVIPNAEMDAKVGRQGIEIPKIIEKYRKEIDKSDIVVIHIGNNGYIKSSILEEIIRTIGDGKDIYFLTVNAPVPWKDMVNENIINLNKFKNVKVIRWDKIEDMDVFVKDKVHLSNRGIMVYTGLIRKSIGVRVTKIASENNLLEKNSLEHRESDKKEEKFDSSDYIIKLINESH